MKNNENNDSMLDKMTLIATLYYKDKLSQQEIAKKLHISRPWVSKLLSRAEELGIVKIEIESPISGNSQLEEQLCQKYHLTYASVIDNQDSSRDYVAMSAVNYFISQIKPNDIIGIGWGNAVSRFIKNLHPMKFPDTQIIPLAGSFGATFEILPNHNAIRLADLTGGTAHLLHVPAFCSSQDEYQTLITNDRTRHLLTMAEHADIAVTGIGTFETSFLTRYEIMSKEEIQTLKNADAIGDIALQFLSKTGKPVDTDITRRMIKADIFEISRNSRLSIGIAEGVYKTDIIHAVLSLHLVNAFFTTKETALSLLDKRFDIS